MNVIVPVLLALGSTQRASMPTVNAWLPSKVSGLTRIQLADVVTTPWSERCATHLNKELSGDAGTRLQHAEIEVDRRRYEGNRDVAAGVRVGATSVTGAAWTYRP